MVWCDEIDRALAANRTQLAHANGAARKGFSRQLPPIQCADSRASTQFRDSVYDLLRNTAIALGARGGEGKL